VNPQNWGEFRPATAALVVHVEATESPLVKGGDKFPAWLVIRYGNFDILVVGPILILQTQSMYETHFSSLLPPKVSPSTLDSTPYQVSRAKGSSLLGSNSRHFA
jgi:hypothetical protein